jgi:hypothetical protein
MKRITAMLGIFAALILALNVKSNAQCGSVLWLDGMINNNQVSIQLLNTSGQPVSSINPSTNYILRIRATGGTCLVSGSGCATGAAPAAFYVRFASGCTIDGRTIPPESTGRDVDSSGNYTANLPLTTLPSGSFSGQVLILVTAVGTQVGSCILNESRAYARFDSVTDL